MLFPKAFLAIMKISVQIITGLILFLFSCREEQATSVVQSQNSVSLDTVHIPDYSSEREYDIDKRLNDCCADSSTNYGMKMCTRLAIKEWESEMDKYYTLLLDALSGESKAALIESQNIWKRYSEKELLLNHAIYNQLDGTIWGLISIEQTMNKVKERALHLKTYYKMLKGEGLKG